MNPLDPLRAYTAHLFAKAAKDLFPQAQLIGGEVDEIGFTYHFDIPQTISPDMLPLFEEKMRGWIKRAPDCRIQEMVPSNAASLFKDRGDVYLKERCVDWEEELVPVICLGNFYDIALSGSLFDAELPYENFAFKLIRLSFEGRRASVFGTAFPGVDELKDFVRKYKDAVKRDGRKMALAARLIAEGRGVASFFCLRGWKSRSDSSRVSRGRCRRRLARLGLRLRGRGP